MLIYDIDIKSEKLKLSKFHSEYDMKFLPEELKNNPYLTFKDYAMHPERLQEIPYSIIEDDIPRIKPRYFSIVNDPYHFEDLKKHHEKSRLFKICFTLLRFPKSSPTQEGFCTSFLKNILDMKDFERRIKIHFSTVNRVIHFNSEGWTHKRTPLIMIAHGTGIVPFVSIFERINNLIESQAQEGATYGPVYLFYGGRNDD